MKSWWQERTIREKAMLSGLGIAIVLLGCVQFIYVPLESYRNESMRAYADATALVREIEEGAALANSVGLRREPVADAPSMRVVVTQAAQRIGLTITRLTPEENDGLGVWLEDTESMLFFRWLLDLSEEHGIAVRRAALSNGDDGMLRAEVTLGGL